jgi:predicted CxxxxCH...CXXCH cytochrome family protein
METDMKRACVILLAFAFAASIAGCSSKLKDTLPTAAAPGVHEADFKDPAKDGFHGRTMKNIGWDLERCKVCHGNDYSGGSSGVSCNGAHCHDAADNGPEACYTCHGDRPGKKACPQTPSHIRHVEGGNMSATKVACSGCHKVPVKYNDPGHLFPLHLVTISAPLALTATKGRIAGDAVYDSSSKTCVNVYCHGNFTNGNNTSPIWDAADQAQCGSCHGIAAGNPLPKAPHLTITTCHTCHAGVVDENMTITEAGKLLHIDGKLRKFGSDSVDW